MIIGIGTDMVEVQRIANALDRFGNRFVQRILTQREFRKGWEGAKLVSYLARQFAAKEAVSKVLGTGMRQGVHFRNINVTRNLAGGPIVDLSGRAFEIAEDLNINHIMVSLSDERDYALAFAVGTRV
ncbi:MAG: holo-[acyl-carrier protein] synthase [Candidatus Azotimanducaceae bacterium]|jgi:holo-[acyl-carrier protein] synthase